MIWQYHCYKQQRVLVIKMDTFKRPSNVDFPTTWHEFVSKSGKKYWIEDVRDEYKEITASFMAFAFAKEEPLLNNTYASTHPDFLINSMKMWKEEIDCNLSLLCMTKNDHGETQIAGISCLGVNSNNPNNYDKPIKKTSISKVLDTYIYVDKKADVFNKLNIKEYLKGIGLYVLPEFRGENIGLELLKAREPLCKAMGIKTTCTVFTSRFSQTIAEKAGFTDLYSITYEELSKINEELFFPGIENHTKAIRFMYKQYT